MQDNPYGAFWAMVHGDAEERDAPVWLTGQVVTVTPLMIRSGGQELTGADLLVSATLLEHERKLGQRDPIGRLEGSPEDFLVTGGLLDATATHGPLLEAGDQVLLLPSADGQQFAVICKLVPAGEG